MYKHNSTNPCGPEVSTAGGFESGRVLGQGTCSDWQWVLLPGPFGLRNSSDTSKVPSPHHVKMSSIVKI